jgi:chemotaxis protein MotB
MARRSRHQHEDHVNHEAWAIPYGDLVTLLLAFFVVMYAMSSVNAGKYRVLSESINAAFRGDPTSVLPVQVGEKASALSPGTPIDAINQSILQSVPRSLSDTAPVPAKQSGAGAALALAELATEIETTLGDLVQANQLAIRRHEDFVEIDIGTDVLFPSGVATLSDRANPVLARVADSLRRHYRYIRVEGHTDDQPIRTAGFPSNWELSAARAASVVHLLVDSGIDPARLGVSAYGEYRPIVPNDSVVGRASNRRVVLVILDKDPTVTRSTVPSTASPTAAPPVAATAVAVPRGTLSAPGQGGGTAATRTDGTPSAPGANNGTADRT